MVSKYIGLFICLCIYASNTTGSPMCVYNCRELASILSNSLVLGLNITKSYIIQQSFFLSILPHGLLTITPTTCGCFFQLGTSPKCWHGRLSGFLVCIQGVVIIISQMVIITVIIITQKGRQISSSVDGDSFLIIHGLAQEGMGCRGFSLVMTPHHLRIFGNLRL